MILTADIGVSVITLGVFDGEKPVFRGELASARGRTVDEYAILLRSLYRLNGVEPQMEGAVLSSVSRPLDPIFSRAVERVCGVRPLILGPGVKTGLKVRAENAAELGGDIAACCIAAQELCKPPLAVIALETATTLTYLDEKGTLRGALICPGVKLGADALSHLAGGLPAISLDAPKTLLGGNTVEAMNNGVICGSAAMIDGLLERLRTEREQSDLHVVITGQLAELVLPFCKTEMRYVPDLVLQGLRLVYERNRKKKEQK